MPTDANEIMENMIDVSENSDSILGTILVFGAGMVTGALAWIGGTKFVQKRIEKRAAKNLEEFAKDVDSEEK